MNSDDTPIKPEIDPAAGTEDTQANPPDPEQVDAGTSDAPAPDPQLAEEAARLKAELTAALQQHVTLLATLQNPLTGPQEAALKELAGTMPESLFQVSRSKSAGLADELLTLARLVKAVTLLEQRQSMVEECLSAVARLSSRSTAEIVNAQKLLRRLKSEIGWPQDAPVSPTYNTLLEAEQKLEKTVASNRDFQTGLLSDTNSLVQELRTSLEAGNSAEAGSLWDKIQGNISNLSGKTQHELKEQISDLRNQVNELREWRKFAAAEKKKELIAEMQTLHETELQPPQKAARIRKLHESWKLLGFSDQNEELWQQFKSISDQAYTPCKEYFQQRKTLMAENFKQRTGICEQIDSFLQTVDRESPRIAELRDFEKQVQDDWKKYAPIEQSKIKKLQKRFYGLLDQVREIRRSTARNNGEMKQALVQKAQQLQELEDRQQAMEQAKALQSEWKTIGPASFREDRKYWEEFRAACDALFRERDEARKARRSEASNAVKASSETLKKLEQLLECDEDTLRDSRKLFASLQREFNQSLGSGQGKDRQQIQERFTSLTRRIEARFRKLPDKKTVQALSALENRARYCLELEEKLLSCSDDQSLRAVIDSFDRDSWSGMDPSGIESFDQSMMNWMTTLLDLDSVKALHSLLDDSERLARRQLVEAEIHANLDSPEQDRALRMELQLSQLQSNFGKSPAEEPGERLRVGREIQLGLLCTGPLSAAMRKEFSQRAERVINRLF